MFGVRKPPAEKNTVIVPIQTIPGEFYAGANPVVKFKTVEREIALPTIQPLLNPRDKKSLDKATAVGSRQPLHPVHWFSNRKALLVGLGIIFVLFIGGASWYYWRQARGAAVVPEVPSTVVKPVPTEVSPAPPQEIATTSPEVIVSPPPTTTPAPTPYPGEGLLDFPSPLIGDSVDSDNDGVTDAEEELFGTDQHNPDTDGDKYSDGHEIYNLYNPKGKEPQKLAESGLVKDFVNPVFAYKMYYPTSWAVGNVDQNYRDVLFSTLTGEYVEVRVFDKEVGYNFADWFAREASHENYSEVAPFTSVFQLKGVRRKDYLVYYFEDERHVYVFLYHTTSSATANYRLVIKMMARSFRFDSTTTVIPSRIVEDGATTTLNGETVNSASSSSQGSVSTTARKSPTTSPL